MADLPNDDAARDDRIDKVIASYLEAVEQGEAPDARTYIAQHPDIAAELSLFFADRAEFQQAAGEGSPDSNRSAVNPGPKPPADPNQPTLGYEEGVSTAPRRIRYLGDYELLEEIARGGMGVVFKARQVTLNRTVAVKMILAGQFASAADVNRFHTEAEAAAQLDHPNIVPIYEVGQHEGQHYFSMGYVEGRSLAARVAEGPPREAAEMVKTVAEAVEYAHQRGVIHRDLKPGNILLQNGGEVSNCVVNGNDPNAIQTGGSRRGTHEVGRLACFVPKITDFGLAKRMEGHSNLTGTGQVLGTPSYMPPEQAGAKLDQIGPTSDVYSIGAVLYCLLTGRPPFQAASPMDTLLQVLGREPVAPRLLNSKLPRDLQTICLKCLRKETAKRYPTAATLAADLGRWLDGKPIVARPVGRGERAWLCCKRRPAVAALSAAIVIISMVGSWVAVERQNAVYAEGLVDSLVKADIGQVRGLMRQMGEYARWAQPMIRERFAQANDDSREKLRLSLVLVASGERHVDDLFEPLLVADAKTFPVIRDVLAERKAAITDRLWAVLRGRDSDPQQRRLRAAGALAEYDPLNAQWAEVAQEVAGQLVTVKALFLGQWQQALRPVADRLAPHLAEIFTDPEQGELPRSLAKSLLVDFSKDDPRTLTRLIVDADPTAFGELFPVLQSHQSRAIEELVAVLDRTVEPTWNDPPLDPLWREVPDEARLAIDAAHGLLAERFAFCQDLPWSDFQQLAESLRHCGYRPVRVRPWHGNGRLLGEDKQGRDVELLVAAIWTRDGELWELETNLAPDQLPQAGEPAEKNGLVPIDIAVLPAAQGGADHRFVLLWGEPTAADERRQIVIDSSEHEIEAVHASLAKQRLVGQTAIGVWTDANARRHYLGIWSNRGAPSEFRAAYAGFEFVDQPQGDVAVAPAAKLADPLDALRRQWDEIGKLPPAQLAQPQVRLTRAQVQYGLGQLQAALADLDFLIEKDAVTAPVLQYRAWTLARLGQNGPARAELSKYLEQPNDPSTQANVRIVLAAWLGDRDEAKEQLEAVATAAAKHADHLYRAACAAALASQACGESDAQRAQDFVERAMQLLDLAVAQGYQNAQQLRADVDLSALHGDPRFVALVERLEGPARYAAVWRADVEFESRLLGPESAELQLEQSRELVAKGYRPVAIAAYDEQSEAGIEKILGVENAQEPGILANSATTAVATVWHRPLVPDVAKEQLAQRQATAAVALLRMGAADRVWPLLTHQPDPRLRSYLLDRLARYGAEPDVVLRRLKTESDLSRRRALILAIGDFARAKLLSSEQQSAATAVLARWYADDDDAGIHGAAEWSLKQLDALAQIAQIRGAKATGSVVGGRQWYLTKEGQQTFVILRPEGDFLMGSPVTEAERFKGPTGKEETRHWRRIGRTFAISAHEVTVEQFLKFRPNHEFFYRSSRESDAPANGVTWYDATAYCNWFSMQEGIDRDQWCYDPDQAFADGMRLFPDHLGRTGYRLPTEAEWEYACRAGATTARHFGETDTLLGKYAWHAQDYRNGWTLPVGSLKPNDWGLFDAYGNALEWCQDPMRYYSRDRAWLDDNEHLANLSDKRRRALRGGAFSDDAPYTRSSYRYVIAPMDGAYPTGFRIARTCP